MATPILNLRTLERFPKAGPEDELDFDIGVNVIVGPPNTGKTKLLNMLDYLFGDPGTPEDAFGTDLAKKYSAAKAHINIGGDEFTLERRWQEHGVRTKVFVNEEPHTTSDFSGFLLDHLNIPILHFPKGSPYAERAWPELSWRSLLRHIYRQERFWNDIADKQVDSEQHACLMQFLGIAEKLYPKELGELVSKQKEIATLQVMKEQYVSLLHEISARLLSEEEIGVALTSDSIQAGISGASEKINALRRKRETTLIAIRETKEVKRAAHDEEGGRKIEELGNQLAQLQFFLEANQHGLDKVEERLQEIREYRSGIMSELERLERATAAGEILVPLRITHCPACDQAVERTQSDGGHCFLCHQPTPTEEHDSIAARKRIDFETSQLGEELREAQELIDQLSKDCDSRKNERRKLTEQVRALEVKLRPVRTAVSYVLPPEFPLIDQEIGRLEERMRQSQRIDEMLGQREDLTTKIELAQGEIEALQIQVDQLSTDINFERAADELAEGINAYLNALSANNPKRWPEGPVSVKLQEKRFRINVRGGNWATKLGATLKFYFLAGYQYSLLRLSEKDGFHYPGFALLDFPLTLTDGSEVADKENYIMEPFVDLCSYSDMQHIQVIVSGRAFQELPGSNRIELTKIWK